MAKHIQRRRGRALRVAALLAVAAGTPAVAEDHSHSAPAVAAAPAPDPAPVSSHASSHASAVASVSADDAVRMLADGNARFVAGTPARPNLTPSRLCDTYANGQHPYAAVLSCADSRVPVEHVLDAGIGDLFVVRVAGNVSDADEIGTLEYGVEHLGINAILVMGHTKCGAVTAVIDKAPVTKNIAKLVDNIEPAAESARKAFPQLTGPRLVHQAIRLNVKRSIEDLINNSDLIAERVKSGRLKIVGGVYDLHSGEIDWLDAATQPTHAAAAQKPLEKSAANSAAHHQETPKVPAHQGEHKSPASAAPHAADARKADSAAAATTPAVPSPKKDNLLALGGMLAGCSLATGLVMHFVSARRGVAPAAPAVPAAG
jgi:carbonic anhydrase